MTRLLTFVDVARLEAAARPRPEPRRSLHGGAELRRELEAAGVLRSSRALPPIAVLAALAIDAAGLDRAAAAIFVNHQNPAALARIEAECDPRIAARLAALRARHGVPGEA